MLHRDPSERVTRFLLLLIILVFADLLDMSFGFNPLSEAPSAPEPAVAVQDAQNQVKLNEPGEIPLFNITHTDEPEIALIDLRIIIGPPNNEFEMSTHTGWGTTIYGLRIEARLNGSAIDNSATNVFAIGDTITVKKTGVPVGAHRRAALELSPLSTLGGSL